MRNLENAVVVVTGASRGIGRAIAEELGSGGAKVVVNYFHHKEEADEVVEHLLKHGSPAAVAMQADVSHADQAARLIEDTIKQFDRIDVLVNNEGINVDRAKVMSVEDWDRVIQTDLNSYFYTLKAALPYFMQQKSGTILNISSLTGQMGNYGQANYGAAKAGIIGFTKTAALELARYNVTVNALSLGAIDTPHMWSQVSQEIKDSIAKRIPLGRFGTPQEVALAARFLVVDAPYCTGTTIQLNGGMYML